jgi:hypothetical protein
MSERTPVILKRRNELAPETKVRLAIVARGRRNVKNKLVSLKQ